MLVLTAKDIASIVDFRYLVSVVERAFAEHGEGRAVMPPKLYLDLPEFEGDFRAMPAFVGGAAGVKWVNSHPLNPSRSNLPTVMAVIVYNDPATGEPLAIMDGTTVTRYRTAAAAAIAAKHLARRGARIVGLIGCGAQARYELEAILGVIEVEEVRAADVDGARARDLAESFPGLRVRPVDAREAAGADIVCTTTPSRRPVVQREWIRPGAHINAMGADAPGKQELDPAILHDARVFVDDREQASHSGEINVPLATGIYFLARIAGTLGEVVAGRCPGRTGEDEITVFDSTGLAVQDVASAKYLYDEARRRRIGTEIQLF